MKKRLNVDLIQSELRGNSAFFPGYRGSNSPTPPLKEAEKATPEPQTASSKPNHLEVQEPVRVPVPPPVPLIPKAKRIMKQRWPIDIYEDQYERLKKIA